MTRGDTLSCGCLVSLVRRSQPATLYDGLTLAEHVARSGIPRTTLQKRVRKYGHPFPPHLSDELRVFEQDRENNRRARSKRIGRAANTHKQANVFSGSATNCGTREIAEDRDSAEYLAEWIARANEQRANMIQAVEPEPARAEIGRPVEEPDGHDVLWKGLTLAEWSRLSGETVRTLFVRMLTTGTPFPERLS
ncbi:hypothetical protein GNZ12_24190 [Paraburkholderia sp. 1N]|uniref:Uncharacterized protein n=1 Tax=Paraburkholderia solitsugae TaxID=2675748 RepID=A0ABX2BUP7_9BURK|nr:hypothetical protein [Paraburkholderia solitsugae]